MCSDVLELAPTGMKEYIQYNLDAFRAADVAMGIINQYAGKIEDVLVEIDALFAENSKNSIFNNGNVYNDAAKHPNEGGRWVLGR